MLKITNNFDDVSKRLRELARKASELDGQHNVPLAELMPPEFVSGCSAFASINELIEASPFKVQSAEDFKAIPDAEWDEYIAEKTSFTSWQEMQGAAAQAWTAKRLGF